MKVMKPVHIFAAVAALSLSLAACDVEKKLLSVEQIGKATIESFFSELDGLVSAGEGLHKELRTFVDKEVLRYGDIRGDMLQGTVSTDEGNLLTYNYALTAEHVGTYPRTFWADGWSVVTAANYILYYGKKLQESGNYPFPSEQAVMEKIFAQAYFARAYAHFYLVNSYAWPYRYTADQSHLGIPVMDHVPGFDDKVERKPVSQVYELIFKDLTRAREAFARAAELNPAQAASLCQTDRITDCYHISDIACEAFLARVYLYIGDWEKAEACAGSVMDKVPLTPYAEYVDMFRKSQDNHGQEAILRMDSYNNTSSMAALYDVSRSIGADFIPDPSMYQLYTTGDIRASLLTYVPLPTEDIYQEGLTFDCVCKYLYDRTITDPYKQVHDCFVLRGSEMRLIYAEAVARGRGDLAAAMEQVRILEARARNVSAADLAGEYPVGSADAVLSQIERERKKELCFEGHRFYDMLRLGQNLVRSKDNNSTMKTLKYPDYRFILPIDRMECQYNEFMEQNEGYEDYKQE